MMDSGNFNQGVVNTHLRLSLRQLSVNITIEKQFYSYDAILNSISR